MSHIQELIAFYENIAANNINSDKYIHALNQIPEADINDALDATLSVLQEDLEHHPNHSLIKQTDLNELTHFLSLPALSQTPTGPSFDLSSALSPAKPSKTKILIITSEGGAGHKEAAADSEKKLLANGISQEAIKKVFVLPQENAKEHSWLKLFGIDFGKKGVKDWNKAQKEGNINKTKRMVSVQWLSELIFGRNMQTNAFLDLTQNQEIRQIIDTQALNSHKIVRAVSEFNQIRTNQKKCERFNRLVKWNQQLKQIPLLKILALKKYSHPIEYKPNAELVMLQKRMTDLPNRADHFFNSLKKIRARDFQYFSLEAPHAAMSKQENVDEQTQRKFDLDYYRKKCPNLFNKQGEPLVHMEFNDGPIRQAFLHYKAHPVDKTKDFAIQIKVANHNELNMVKQSTDLHNAPTTIVDPKKPQEAQTLEMTIPAQAQVDSVMLGSQAAVDATLAYIDTKIELGKVNEFDSPQYLFVFCGKHDSDDSLFAKVNHKVEEEKSHGNLPANFKIVPLTYQDDNMIASLYSRADSCFIRAGGISCMEIEAVSQGKVYIHSEKKGAHRTLRELLKAMLNWEHGNAEHVITRLGEDNVFVVNPQTYRKQALESLTKKEVQQDIRKKLTPSYSQQSKLTSFSSKKSTPTSSHHTKKPKPH